jgi:hypothetical protein
MLRQEIHTIQITKLCDLYYGRVVTDNTDEILKIIKTYHNKSIIEKTLVKKDASGNPIEEFNFLTHFQNVYKMNGVIFIDFEVWSDRPIPEDHLPVGKLIEHYNPVYCYAY